MSPDEIAALVAAARAVRARAYAPYSLFQVGAALLGQDGSIHAGVNVENSAYPTSQCAERSALGVAVSAGVRAFKAVAVITPVGKSGLPGVPCGGCRQALSEFGLHLIVIMAGPTGEATVTTLAELLPSAFTAESL